ncbi:ABC transporter ATP-binding protein [Maridesulfovibrio sp.]|uniref:ABC transporter ATP-binding protein n=1 Tax=Maridesulfovibrio sp. TaxID=2795000 RepID=UPI002A1898F8|nr:ABC transporter ATP-binding protein [Maridesulfovibrio sp.]
MASVILNGIGKSFAGTPACSGVDLEIESGEFFTFLGPSGCGKTTILRLIAGFEAPDEGRILLDGKDITHLAPEKRKVGMVFQNYALFPHLTVYGNIEYGLKGSGRTAADIRTTVEYYMEMIGLGDYGKRNISELSGGEQQRVALARSLAVEPQVLLLDEPLCNLDARLRERMRTEIRELQKRLGITTVFVTHDQTEALTISDRIAVFERGGIAQTGTPREIYSDPVNSFVARFVGDTNLFPVAEEPGAVRVSPELSIPLGGRPSGKYISIRPQDISLSHEPVHAGNSVAGRVEEVQHNGLWINYGVRAGEMSLFRVAVLNCVAIGTSFQVGESVFLSFDEDAVKVFAD